MDRETEQHWLVLQEIAAGNNRTLLKLREIASDPLDILLASDRLWLRRGVNGRAVAVRKGWQRSKLSAARKRQRELNALEAATLSIDCPDYPPLLREIPDPPALLFAQGNVSLLHSPLLAVVGSRKASAAGRRATRELCSHAVTAGLGIASGMALGIDAEAHRAALDSEGVTVAVVATGLDLCYPPQHRQLAQEIVERGVLLTEFALGSRPLPERFPQRNRIISGLSLGVLIVEAALRSGSLITARMALEQNREVFALPHSIYHRQGRGCNALIGEGARLVQSAEDIFLELGPIAGALRNTSSPQAGAAPIDPAHEDLLALLGGAAWSLDELVAASDMDAARMMSLVTEMQLLGLLENRAGRYARC